MMETIDSEPTHDAPDGSICGSYHCSRPAMSTCAICGKLLCAQHRHWVPNGGIGSNGELLQAPYCDICTLRYVRQRTGAEFEMPEDGEPDEPYQSIY